MTKSKKKTTVTFLGEEVSISRARQGHVGIGAKRSLWLLRRVHQTSAVVTWEAYSTGTLTPLRAFGNGKTPQAAAKVCEAACFRAFNRKARELKAIGAVMSGSPRDSA